MAEAIGTMEALLEVAVPSRVVEARSDSKSSSSSTASCTSNSDGDTCQKPTSESNFTMPIILGVCIPIAGALILFFVLHRRHVRKQRMEDMNDRHASLDFGLGDVQAGRQRKKTAGVSTKEVDMKEKPMRGKGQSMDMGLDSPYLLPPELQSSRESLQSLSRTDNEDPYRPVNSYYPNDGSSIRSASRLGRDNSSIYTASSQAPSRLQDLKATDAVGPLSRNAPSVVIPNPHHTSLHQSTASNSPIVESSLEEVSPFAQPVQPPEVHLAKPASPPPAQAKPLPASLRISRNLAAPSPATSNERDSYNVDSIRQSNNYLVGLIESREPSPTPPAETQSPPRSRKSPPPAINTSPEITRPLRKESLTAGPPPVNVFADGEFGDAFKVTPPSPGRENEVREQRYSMDVPPEEFANAGLGAPGFDPRRLSMGFRPLPPNALTEVDDPEIRANRIRSFYKEYFDESKPLPQGQYYEDFDENYLGEAAYFDPDQNNFVMPYAQPVTRRAMTPPPRGPRFQGPPRGNHASMGGGRGPQMYPPGPYPQGPRAFSSASGRPGIKKPMPPPAALTSLPTPSKLKDDSFALMGAIDFAPPLAYRDRAAGRSESPLGERRPYSPMVPAFTPTRSAFDDLAAMPSPHMLRKSGTFTGLDFAPPKRFKDVDSASDAGSIRSNRSGVSAMQHAAIRNGAYRVSRIPQDVVFTRDDLTTTLKPQWGMRPHDV